MNISTINNPFLIIHKDELNLICSFLNEKDILNLRKTYKNHNKIYFELYFKYRKKYFNLENYSYNNSKYITKLLIDSHDNIKLASEFTNLTHLKIIGKNIPQLELPITLKYLQFGDDLVVYKKCSCCTQINISDSYIFNQNILPKNLEVLIFGNEFNESLNIILPEKLKYINFGNNYNKPIDKIIFPNSLETLIFGNNFNQSLNVSSLQNTNLQKLILKGKFNNLIDLNFFPNLQTLILSDNFNQPLFDSNLCNLKYLVLARNFNKKIDFQEFPQLRYLEFGANFQQSIDSIKSLQYLQTLRFNNYFFINNIHLYVNSNINLYFEGKKFHV